MRRVTFITILLILIALPSSYVYSQEAKDNKVKIDFFIMSYCPFTIPAENNLLPIIKENPDIFDLKFYFIASIKNEESTDTDQIQQSQDEKDNNKQRTDTCSGSSQEAYGKFLSLHGPEEAKENIRQLIIGKYFKDKLIDYILLRNKDIEGSDPRQVMTSLGIDSDFVESMIATEEGEKLFEESIKECDNRSVNASPTIYINGNEFKGNIAKNPILRRICKDNNYSLCEQVPVCGIDLDCKKIEGKEVVCMNPEQIEAECVYGDEVEITVNIVNLKNIDILSVAGIEEGLKSLFNKVSIIHFDFDSDNGKKLVEEYNSEILPAVLFDKAVEKSVRFQKISNILRPSGDKYLLKPEAIPNRYYFKRDNKSRSIELFINSMSPTAMQLQNFLMLQGNLSFTVNYNIGVIPKKNDNDLIVKQDGDKYSLDKPAVIYNLTSPYGEEDIYEDVRQMCIYKYKPELLGSYLRCSNNERLRKNMQNNCYSLIIGEDERIKNCASGDEGFEMLVQNSAYSRSLNVMSDVAVLVNNRFLLQQFDLNQIFRLYERPGE